MAASQGHGFIIQDCIIDAIYPTASANKFPNVPKPRYIATFDVPPGHSDWNSAHPCQIKTATAESVDHDPAGVMLGDALRNFSHNIPFEAVIADMAQKSDNKVARRYVRLAFEVDGWRTALFGSKMTREAFGTELATIDRFIKSIPRGPQNELRVQAHAMCRALESASGMGASLQAKISTTGKQRRLQLGCSQKTMIDGAARSHIIVPSEFGTLGLPASIQSKKRERNKKTKPEMPAPASPPAALETEIQAA